MIIMFSVVENDGDYDKLTQIYKLYRSTMIHTARGMLGDADADDAVSEAILKIMKYVGKISEVNCHETRVLVVLIVRNAARDILRKQKRLAEEPLVEEMIVTGDTNSPLCELSAKEACDLIASCIGELSKRYSDILYLANQGFSYLEISELLSISEENARQRLRRARNALRQKLMERGYEYEGQR